jgi:transcriptional regulator with AAA-type ATPase domain
MREAFIRFEVHRLWVIAQRRRIYDQATANFAREKRKVLIGGPTGAGETHLAKALARDDWRARSSMPASAQWRRAG